MVRIKVCGITSERDALEAVYLGVDALGFVFWPPSPRAISPSEAGTIASKLPPFVSRVGVFVDADAATIERTAKEARLTAVQLHGEETPAACRRLSMPWFKAFRTGPAFRVERLADYACNAYLIEGDAGEKRGGAGAIADWNLARAAARYGRVILSGGLTPANVEAAIAHVKPYGVDVGSGVEARPGIKDIDALEAFVIAARRAGGRLLAEQQSP